MKVTCQIRVDKENVGAACMAHLARLSPHSYNSSESFHTFFLETAADAPVVQQVLKVLKAEGLKLPVTPAEAGGPSHVNICYLREFEDVDYDRAEYLQVCYAGNNVLSESVALKRVVGKLEKRSARDLAASYRVDTMKLDKAGGYAMRDQLVVLDHIKALLLKEDFKQLTFRQCEPLSDPHGYFDEGLDPVWEVQSGLVLPPLAAGCQLYEMEAYDGSGDIVRAVNDDLVEPGLLKYRAADLRRLKPFDVARTRERLGWGLCDHPLVVSQRFYQFCKRKKLDCGWLPVRIDPD